MPQHQNDKDGPHITNDRAEEAAKFWATEVWNNSQTQEQEQFSTEQIHRGQPYNTRKITMKELITTIKRFKRRQTPGPDEIPIETFKELGRIGLVEILNMLNKWWEEEEEEMPEEVCQARIALIKKKGDTADQRNYRPISLLNSIYKIFAAILKNRIAEQAQNKQYILLEE